jgi:lipopolysaccharide transport system permease protein
MLLFWITPIVYPVTMVPATLQPFFKLSPLAAFAIAYQDVLFWGRVPEGLVLLTLLAWTAAALLGGLAVFRRYSPAFAEEV